jgi:hypothetical protein
MANEQVPLSPVFSIDVTAAESQPAPPAPARGSDVGNALIQLTKQLIEMQKRQNTLLEQLLQINHQVLQANNQANAQRQSEITQWRKANPDLVRSCQSALELLSGVQTEFLKSLTDEVEDQHETLSESEYAFNDFLDRYGPRMAHLNGVLQVLGHLAG